MGLTYSATRVLPNLCNMFTHPFSEFNSVRFDETTPRNRGMREGQRDDFEHSGGQYNNLLVQ